MIHLSLKTRYTTIILSFIISTALVLTATLLFNFRKSSDELTELHERAISSELLRYVQEQGQNLGHQLAENLANPLYFFDMDAIQQLLEVALAHPDINQVWLFDGDGNVVHNGQKDLSEFGHRAPVGHSQLEKLKLGRSQLRYEEGGLHILEPVTMGEDVLGGLCLLITLENINADIENLRVVSDDARRSSQQWVVSNAVIITAMLLVIGAVFAVYVARRLNQPIQQLVSFTDRVGMGEFDQTTGIDRKDEIGDLANALNKMAVSLNQRTEEIHFLAYHDSLTELPNRRFFQQILNDTVAQARRKNEIFALLFIDLDNFKLVNDSQGHNAGDFVIQTIAGRINGCIRDVDCVTKGGIALQEQVMSRVGGDEFVVLLKDIADPLDAATVAKRIISAVSEPFTLQERQIAISTSIGIATFPHNGSDSETLLKNADMAMYSAKAAGKNDYHYFSEALDQAAHEKLEMLADLSRVLPNNELELWYQPQYDLSNGHLVGAEALLRWRHPEKGLISPALFIPVAEESDLIHQIGAWVIQQASSQLQLWNRVRRDFHISINVSAAQLQRETLINDLASVLPALGELASNLHLEITETYLLKDEVAACETLERVKASGVKIWLDDFGTGYSALSHLKRYPVDGVKIDRSFVSDLDSDQENRTLTQAVIALAEAFGLDVVAEGVETERQQQLLRQYGCRLAQGYHLGKPMPASAFDALLREKMDLMDVAQSVT